MSNLTLPPDKRLLFHTRRARKLADSAGHICEFIIICVELSGYSNRFEAYMNMYIDPKKIHTFFYVVAQRVQLDFAARYIGNLN